ncbi:MAG: D-2-hydroxyacid dehydrogenase [Actinomycetota bacterium]
MKILVARPTADRSGDEIRAIVPTADVVVVEEDASVTGDASGVEVIYWGAGVGSGPKAMSMLGSWNDPALRWVQGPNAGYDHPIWVDLIERDDVIFTRAANIWTEPMAQYVTAWMLAWSQGLGGQMLRSQHHEWNQVPPDDLTGRTLGIVGYGGIGSATARIARAIGMRVLATRRTPGEDPHVDEMLTPDRLHELLAAADYVVLCCPLTEATTDLIGAAEFAAMGSGTVLINVARGEVVVEEALADALQTGTIRGATIDVTRQEPLPVDSPLWDLPNIVITPHQSGEGPRSQERLDALFLKNLRRYVVGDEMINLVTEADL